MPLVRHVLRKFAPVRSTWPTSTAAPSPEPPAPVITAPAAIRDLYARRQLLKVTLANKPGSYQSLILAIDPQRRLLWLDDLFPTQAHLQPGDALEVSHHHNGEVLAFPTTVVALGQHCGVSGLALSLPKAAHYRPRRQWSRLVLAHQPRVPVLLSLPGASAQYGQILNVSAGGLRVSVPGNWRPHLRHGDEIPLCEFTLAPGLTVRCRTRVCAYQGHHRPWRQTHISMAFMDLPSTLKDAVQRFVASRLQAPDRRAA